MKQMSAQTQLNTNKLLTYLKNFGKLLIGYKPKIIICKAKFKLLLTQKILKTDARFSCRITKNTLRVDTSQVEIILPRHLKCVFRSRSYFLFYWA